ncbi:hypothetical protein [Flavobacterium marginilacus]|uniref:hypothetical protein n=1 Tax=Flavobacterium marginilacus TaxID=3003256 RepID=UPI00248DB4B3|nr:hypothetical protein [Flavobacterium marginilacus]
MQIGKMFSQKKIYKDDISVPKETIIYYSRNKVIFSLVNILGICALVIYLLPKEYFGLLFLGLGYGLYLLYIQINKLRDKAPQIVINDKGIKLKNKNLVPWNKIYGDRIFCQTFGKSPTNYLVFNKEEIEIDDLTIKSNELEKLLHVYRVRYDNDNS